MTRSSSTRAESGRHLGTKSSHAVRRIALPAALCTWVVLWACGASGARAPARAPVRPHPMAVLGADVAPESTAPAVTSCGDPCVSRASDPSAAEILTLRGVVVDPEGSPISDAVVRASFGHFGLRSGFRTTVFAGEAATTTDSLGRFSLDTPTSSRWAVVNVDAPHWVEPDPRVAWLGGGTDIFRGPRERVWASAFVPPMLRPPDGHGEDEPVEIPADARAMGLVDGVDGTWPLMRIVLQRGGTIEGTVLTGAGAPVPGAAVTARWQDGLPGWRTLEASADACGRFSMLVPAAALITAAPVGTVGGRVLAKDVQAWAWPVQPGTSDLRLVLADQVALDLDVRNAPIPMDFARVDATPAGFPGPCDWLVRVGRLHVKADGDAVRVAGLLPGISDLVIHPPGGNYVAAPARVSAPGARALIEWPRMDPVDGILEGEDIQDFDVTWTGRAPAAGTTVVRIGVDAWPPGRLLADPLGCFRLYASGPGAICARRAGDPRCAWVPSLDPSGGFLRLSLATGRVIRGQVEGRPGMTLSALRVRAVAGGVSETVAVGDDGSFTIVGLPPIAFRVELRSGAWLHDARDDVPAGASGVCLRVRLPPTDPG
jgi:hypothetical protein